MHEVNGYASINGGVLKILIYRESIFSPERIYEMPVDNDRLLAQVIMRHGLESLMCSSSIDFPDDNGVWWMPDGWSARETIDRAYSRIAEIQGTIH
jgi:hypothetical protein